MLALETQLNNRLEEFERRSQQLSESDGAGMLQFIKDIDNLKIPPYHSLVVLYGELQHKVHMQYIASITTNKCQGPQPLIVPISRIEHIIQVQQTLLTYPNKDIISYYRDLALMYGVYSRDYSMNALNNTVSMFRKAICAHAILMGREQRSDDDQHFIQVLLSLPKPEATSMQYCAFCHERPDNAAMKRSQCGACKQILYCSRGCQKAHWPVHKQQCKKVAK